MSNSVKSASLSDQRELELGQSSIAPRGHLGPPLAKDLDNARNELHTSGRGVERRHLARDEIIEPSLLLGNHPVDQLVGDVHHFQLACSGRHAP
jgi:hypothetical protein